MFFGCYLNKLYDTPTLKNGTGEWLCFTTGSVSLLPSPFFTLTPLRLLVYKPPFITIARPAWAER